MIKTRKIRPEDKPPFLAVCESSNGHLLTLAVTEHNNGIELVGTIIHGYNYDDLKAGVTRSFFPYGEWEVLVSTISPGEAEPEERRFNAYRINDDVIAAQNRAEAIEVWKTGYGEEWDKDEEIIVLSSEDKLVGPDGDELTVEFVLPRTTAAGFLGTFIEELFACYDAPLVTPEN
ncbi:hypothetical protein JIN85_17030 [Luteolibacter pohnpeiensis]|uniref:Uncharacterized protein n=1 Tax=Luteolibacter pohnpeiensis TaxID=454153 RepID=A0A934SDH4_9BACT|nr:hypothetical protein [Luteolibacter pohnpeiensis]MBK1884127.1 hypothetical protein [Luteolibacter pohnpeiensis]